MGPLSVWLSLTNVTIIKNKSPWQGHFQVPKSWKVSCFITLLAIYVTCHYTSIMCVAISQLSLTLSTLIKDAWLPNHNHFTNIQVYSLNVAWNLSYHISYADVTADKLILITSIICVQSVKVKNCQMCYYCVIHPKHFLNMLQVRQFL